MPRNNDAKDARHLAEAMDGSYRLTRSKTSLKRSAVETFQDTLAKIPKTDSTALIGANIRLLQSLGYTVSAPKAAWHAIRPQTTKVNAVCMSFEHSDLNTSKQDESLDHELEQFRTFMRQFVGIDFKPLIIKGDWKRPDLESMLRRLLTTGDEDILTIFLYAGHGRADAEMKTWKCESYHQNFSWTAIAGVLEKVVYRPILLVLDACNSSAAVSAFKDMEDSMGNAGRKIVTLAACAWNSFTASWGPATLSKKLMRALYVLMQGQSPLSMTDVYARIARDSLWCSNQPLLIHSPGAETLGIPIDHLQMFSGFHQELADHSTTKKFMSLAREVCDIDSGKAKRQKLKAMIMMSRAPFAQRCRPQCGDKVIAIPNIPHTQTTREVLREWREDTSLRANIPVSLEYFAQTLHLDVPFLEQLEAIKKANVEGKYREDNIYRVAVLIGDRKEVLSGLNRGCLMTEMCRYAGLTEQGLPCGESRVCEQLLVRGTAVRHQKLYCTHLEPMLEKDREGEWRTLAGTII